MVKADHHSEHSDHLCTMNDSITVAFSNQFYHIFTCYTGSMVMSITLHANDPSSNLSVQFFATTTWTLQAEPWIGVVYMYIVHNSQYILKLKTWQTWQTLSKQSAVKYKNILPEIYASLVSHTAKWSLYGSSLTIAMVYRHSKAWFTIWRSCQCSVMSVGVTLE